MLKTLVVGAAAALLMTSNAIADGVRAAKASPVCCEPNWTGFYIGLGVGGAFVSHGHSAKLVTEEGGTSFVDPLWNLDNGRSMAFGTVTVGYDHRFTGGNGVLGVFVDYDFGNGKNNSRILEIAEFSDIHLSDENKHAWSIGSRFGFLSSPSTLLYLAFGWTRVSLDRDVSFVFDGTEHRRSFDKDRIGLFVGAGIETQLGWLHSGLSLRGEYRYTRFSDDPRKFTFEEGGCGSCTETSRLEFDHDIDVHSVRVVLAYKFGRREVVAPSK